MKSNELLKMNKQGKWNYEQYEKSNWYTLWDAYDSPSYNKEKAWDYCCKLFAKLNGTGLKVISKNTYVFTAGFEFEVEDTGEIAFCYITPSYDRYYEIAL